MRTLISSIRIFLAIVILLAASALWGRAYAVVAPQVSEMKIKDGPTPPNAYEKINETRIELEKIVLEMQEEQNRRQQRLETIKKELDQLESLKEEESGKKRWIPARIAMALGEDSK